MDGLVSGMAVAPKTNTNGSLASGNIDQNLRNPCCLILSHTRMGVGGTGYIPLLQKGFKGVYTGVQAGIGAIRIHTSQESPLTLVLSCSNDGHGPASWTCLWGM